MRPLDEKSHGPLQLGSAQRKLLVRTGAHVDCSRAAGVDNVLVGCSDTQSGSGDSRFFLSGSVDDLRAALLAIAATTLATAGVVFTLLTLPLGTVVAQYGSRLLRVFLGDRTTQLVLGMFVFTFVYCMAAALSIQPVRRAA